jgi:hypothetical protein
VRKVLAIPFGPEAGVMRPSSRARAVDGGCCTKPSARTWSALTVTAVHGAGSAEAERGAPLLSDAFGFFDPTLRTDPVSPPGDCLCNSHDDEEARVRS